MVKVIDCPKCGKGKWDDEEYPHCEELAKETKEKKSKTTQQQILEELQKQNALKAHQMICQGVAGIGVTLMVLALVGLIIFVLVMLF